MMSAATAGEMRRSVHATAIGAGCTQRRADALVLAAWEAIVNAIEHGTGEPVVTISRGPGRLSVQILEPLAPPEGAGWGDDLGDPSAVRGRGRLLMRMLADEVRTWHGPAGLYLELAVRLRG